MIIAIKKVKKKIFVHNKIKVRIISIRIQNTLKYLTYLERMPKTSNKGIRNYLKKRSCLLTNKLKRKTSKNKSKLKARNNPKVIMMKPSTNQY